MDKSALIEIFGYIGSALVVISMLMPSIVKLRVINTAGSIISGIYAVICGAIPLAIMNICLIVINVTRLVKLLRTKQDFELTVGNADDAFVKYFMDHYEADIKTYFPSFDKTQMSGKRAYMVCCDGTPAGLTIGDSKDKELSLFLDYSTPVYRDCSVAKYLYSKLSENGFQTLRYAQDTTDAHLSYLKKMGFTENKGCFVKTL